MPLTCCTPAEFEHWKRPGVSVDVECDALTLYKPGQYGNHKDVEHGFCKEADLKKCRELRAKGLCSRNRKEYEKMVMDMSRKKL